MRWAGLTTVAGDVSVGVEAGRVCAIQFTPTPPGRAAPDDPVLAAAVTQLREYFDGSRQEFELPLTVRGGSTFERAVWEQMTTIGYGEMRTYGVIAATLGDPAAARAVGLACNHNPLPIVVPCHRVVGAGGKLVGFGAGLPWKKHLLALEAKVRIEQTFAS